MSAAIADLTLSFVSEARRLGAAESCIRSAGCGIQIAPICAPSLATGAEIAAVQSGG